MCAFHAQRPAAPRWEFRDADEPEVEAETEQQQVAREKEEDNEDKWAEDDWSKYHKLIQQVSQKEQLKRAQLEKEKAAAKAALKPVKVIIHIDKELGLTTDKEVRAGSTVSDLKMVLAEDDPSGQMAATDIELALHLPGGRRRRLQNNELLVADMGELEICGATEEWEEEQEVLEASAPQAESPVSRPAETSTHSAEQGTAAKSRRSRASAFSSRFPVASKHILHAEALTDIKDSVVREDAQEEKKPEYDKAGLLAGITGSRSLPPTILDSSTKASSSSSAKAWGSITWTGPAAWFQIGNEVLPMRFEREEPLTPADVAQIWERDWGIQYASRLKFSAQTETGMRILKPRSDVLPLHPEEIRLDAGAGGLSVLSVLVSALKKYGGMTAEEVRADREQKQRDLEAAREAKSAAAGDSARQRWVLQAPARSSNTAGDVESRLGQLRGAPRPGTAAPKGPVLRMRGRGVAPPFAGRIMPGASSTTSASGASGSSDRPEASG